MAGNRSLGQADGVLAAIDQVRHSSQEGLRLYASLRGRVVADVACGLAGRDTPMRRDTVVPWLSGTKPIAAVVLARLHECGAVDLDEPVVRYVSEFGGSGKDLVTIRHLLSHTAVFARDLTPSELLRSWDDATRAACAVPLALGTIPGQSARYTAFLGWQLLAEIVQRVTGVQYRHRVRDTVFEPLGMEDCWVGVPGTIADRLRRQGRHCTMYLTSGTGRRALPYVNEDSFRGKTVPGMGGFGPLPELARFYAALLDEDVARSSLGLSPATVALLTSASRCGLDDPNYGGAVRWGLGFVTDRRFFAGVRCSLQSFGHDGRRSSLSFADPERGLVVCLMTNEMDDVHVHRRRFRRVLDALLDDLDGHDPAPNLVRPRG